MDLLPSLPSARFAWMGLMITCITWHYGFGENGATVRPLFGPPTPTQFSSLVRGGTATGVMCRLNPKSIGARDWVWDLNCSAISYSGEEVRIAEPASEVQNESQLPPCGVAANIPIVPLRYGKTRCGILNPQLIRKDEVENDSDWPRPRFHVESTGEKHKVLRLLWSMEVFSITSLDRRSFSNVFVLPPI